MKPQDHAPGLADGDEQPAVKWPPLAPCSNSWGGVAAAAGGMNYPAPGPSHHFPVNATLYWLRRRVAWNPRRDLRHPVRLSRLREDG